MNRPMTKTGIFRQQWLAYVQWAAVGVGLVLVGWFVLARGHGLSESRVAIDEFRGARRPILEVEPIGDLPGTMYPDSPVDTSLWSEGRIEAYDQTLLSDSREMLAILSIPSVDLEVPVFDGTDEWVLDRGAGRIEGTALPGQEGNAGIAAHRDGFFRPLKDVEVGDSVVVETPQSRVTYLVESLRIVDPADVSVLDQTEGSVVTLVTCYPFYFVGSAPQRFIVRATRLRGISGS